jgi:hypothetical protein
MAPLNRFLLTLVVGAVVCVWIVPDQLAIAQGGSLACNRTEGQCHIERGWLLRDTEAFPASDLTGARVTWSRHVRGTWLKAFRVEVLTRSASARPLAGWTQDSAAAHANAAAIQTFAESADTPSVEVRQPADTLLYAIAGSLVAIYALAILAFATRLVRRPERAS